MCECQWLFLMDLPIFLKNIEINKPPRNKQVKRMSSLFIVIIELVKFKIFGSNLSMRNFMMTFIKSRNNTSKEISNDNFL